MNRKRNASIVASTLFGFLFALAIPSVTFGQTRQQKVLGDKLKFEANGTWFYNDLEKGFETAARLKQPMLVVLRCIPCEECVKLDDDLIEVNPKLQQLLQSFVRVRVVGTNGLDLSLFQFDTDQSFAAFIFNADGTLYGRFGTRSDRTEWKSDVSVEGLGKALEAALELHRNYPSNQDSLLGKQAEKPLFESPEKIPSLAKRYTSKLDYEGDTVKSCIHCHMIGEAIKSNFRNEQGKIPESWLYPFPHPKNIGLILDPMQCATIKEVTKGSVADRVGFRAGDRIVSMQGQTLISIADVQWVLHRTPAEGGTIVAKIQRGENQIDLSFALPQGWRAMEDISWRASSWSFRQMGLGGMMLKSASNEQRQALGIKDGNTALVVEHVGAYAPHDRAKKAGVQKGDVLIEYDGRSDFVRESDLLAYSVNQVEVGRAVKLRMRRGAEEQTFEIATSKKD